MLADTTAKSAVFIAPYITALTTKFVGIFHFAKTRPQKPGISSDIYRLPRLKNRLAKTNAGPLALRKAACI
jgi:hypothetical protein